MKLEHEDYEAIRQRLARLCHDVDFGRAEAYADHFTADGAFAVVGLDVGPAATKEHVGRAGLTAMVEDLFAATKGHCRHWTGAAAITAASDHVDVVSYFQVVRIGQVPQAGTILTGVYYDEFVVGDDGRWLLRKRVCSCDPQPGHSEPSTDPLVVARDQAVGA